MKKVLHELCPAAILFEGEGRLFEIGDLAIAVYNRDGKLFAINAVCPHMGSLIDTRKLHRGEAVCFHHHMRFDPETGRCANAPGLSAETYELTVENGKLFVAVWED